ncbi:MAG: putative peptidoglycan glycosyltransferase FtsW [candidate division Zixibacteria bacterium]|nr:putative peptidoglycan glycosyltransferase FtsW [candidate division Zixibacteria bacterium]
MKKLTADKKIREQLFTAYIIIIVIGLVMIYSTSSVMAESRFGSNFYFLKNQFFWVLVSMFAIWIINKVDLKKIAIYSAPSLFGIMLLLLLVFLMPTRNGSHRWLILGPFTMQPSELFKLFMIFYLAFSLSNPKRNLSDWKQLLFPYVPLLGLGMMLIVLEPDLGTVLVIAITAISIFFLAGAKLKHMIFGLAPMVMGALVLVFGLGYKKARIMDFIASIGNPLLGSYQSKQAALTLGAGGITGAGLGDGRQKLFFLPYPHTDFIFASIGEEMGLIGLLSILSILFFILWKGLKVASMQPDKFGFLLAAGMTISLFINIAINLGVVCSILPVTGLPLPFISYGGSSLLISSAAIGVLLNLSRRVVVKR